MGVGSLPVRLGVQRAAQVACWVMSVPQALVVLALMEWGQQGYAAVVALILAAQLLLMRRFLVKPAQRAVWYSGFGVLLYVLGMLASAFALRASGVAGMGA